MLRFFDTGQSPIPAEETLEITSICEAGNQAILKPDVWIDCPA